MMFTISFKEITTFTKIFNPLGTKMTGTVIEERTKAEVEVTGIVVIVIMIDMRDMTDRLPIKSAAKEAQLHIHQSIEMIIKILVQIV